MNATWPSEYILLALLCERPMHGYELHQLTCTDEGLRAIWRIERSQLYFLLRKLADQGYIVQTAGEQAGGPPRLIYAPTPTGRAALKKWLRTPERYPRDLRTAFLAKLYFTLRSQPQSALDLIDEQKRVLGEWAARQRERAAGDDFVAMVHKLRLSQTEAALAYLDELLTLIANSERTQANS
jgi:PadR family transcriptional regulator AphA